MKLGWAIKNDLSGMRSFDSRSNELFDDEYFLDLKDGPPPETVPLPLSVEVQAAQEKEDRNARLALAANRMGPLQDAVDTGRATDEEVAKLTLWKAYRIDLNRIEQQEGFPSAIQWPLSPDEAPAPEPVETPTE